MKKYNLYGASGHCKVVIDIITLNHFVIENIFDDNKAIKSLLGFSVTTSYNPKTKYNNMIIAVGDNKTRQNLADKLSQNNFASIAHPTAILDKSVKIDYGTVLMAGVVINSSTTIGRHCIINTSSAIDHDCIIGDFSHISPNVTLCGNVNIGKCSHIGAGSVIIPGINIGDNVIIGAGSVVIEDVPDNTLIVGNPGKIIRKIKK